MRVVAVAPGFTESDARGRDGDVGHAGAGRFSRRARAALCGVMTPRHDGGARGDGAGSKAVSALALDRGDRRSAWSTPDASRASYVAAARITLAVSPTAAGPTPARATTPHRAARGRRGADDGRTR